MNLIWNIAIQLDVLFFIFLLYFFVNYEWWFWELFLKFPIILVNSMFLYLKHVVYNHWNICFCVLLFLFLHFCLFKNYFVWLIIINYCVLIYLFTYLLTYLSLNNCWKVQHKEGTESFKMLTHFVMFIYLFKEV